MPSTLLPKEIGNCYAASLYAGLLSLIAKKSAAELEGKRVCMFSYGSGCVASAFAVRPRANAGSKYTLAQMRDVLRLPGRLAERTACSVGDYTRALDERQRLHDHLVLSTSSPAAMKAFQGCTPKGDVRHVAVGAFYLARVTAQYQREYVLRTAADAAVDAESPRSWANHPGQTLPLDLDALLAPGWASTRVTGIAAGIPGRARVFNRSSNLSDLLAGEPLIEALSADAVNAVLARKPLRRTVSVDPATGVKTVADVPLASPAESLQVASTLGAFDLAADYGVTASFVAGMESTCQLAVAAAFEALLDAELVPGDGEWKLDESLRERTGIVCAASYAGVEASIDAAQAPSFDRKFLFKVLVPGAAQIAQLVGARGPCIQLNAACAGTTQAIAVAQDWLNGSGWGHRSPRVDRVIVVASDNATSTSLLPFVGGGFAALGAASTSASPELSAMPFDARRNGMVLGAGAVALVLERSSSSAAALPRPPTERSKCCLIATQISNSAFHGSRLDAEHIAFEMVRFFADVDAQVRLPLPLPLHLRRIVLPAACNMHGVTISAQPVLQPQPHRVRSLARLRMRSLPAFLPLRPALLSSLVFSSVSQKKTSRSTASTSATRRRRPEDITRETRAPRWKLTPSAASLALTSSRSCVSVAPRVALGTLWVSRSRRSLPLRCSARVPSRSCAILRSTTQFSRCVPPPMRI